MEDKKTTKPKGQLKKRHLGLAGLATVLIQYGVGVQNEKNQKQVVSDFSKLQIQELRREIDLSQARIETQIERNFARKNDLTESMRKVDAKLEKIADGVGAMSDQVAKIEGYLKAKEQAKWEGSE